MKIAARVLKRFISLPPHTNLRELLDDVGVEVKRVEQTDLGPVFTVELLANRGDHYCYSGVAREISGRTGQPLTRPDCTQLHLGPSPVPLTIQSDKCLGYSLTLLEKVGEPAALDHDSRVLLEMAGVGSVSAPVDATNVANFELGQPTHAFDADTLVGTLCVRESTEGETAHPLFAEQPITLPVGSLVIADDEKILAIAGVIGCESSKTTDQTTRILLESATFDPVSVRKTGRALDLYTDSSARFERGADAALRLVGAGRVVHLLESTGAWRRVGPTTDQRCWQVPRPIIALNIPFVADFLVSPLTYESVSERLSRYGFWVSPRWPAWTEEGWVTPDALQNVSKEILRNTALVAVPPGRIWDVAFAADLIEELAKSIGYNALPTALPPVNLGAQASEPERAKMQVEEVLIGAGFYEVFTDGFYGPAFFELLDIPEQHPLRAHVRTQNALDRGYSLLKNNALYQAIQAISQNVRLQNTSVSLFEWTRLFLPDEDAPNGVCHEQAVLWGAMLKPNRSDDWSSPKASVLWRLKSLLHEMGVALGSTLSLGPAHTSEPICGSLHPTRQASVLLNGEPIGFLGELHPSVLRRFKIKKLRPCFFQLNTKSLLRFNSRGPLVTPPDHPPSVRSLAFFVPHRVQAGDVSQHMLNVGPKWLSSVKIVDVFPIKDPSGAAITFELIYQNDDSNRSADEINLTGEYLIQSVHKHFAEVGVHLR